MKSSFLLLFLATTSLAYRKEGPACQLRNGIPGLCVATSACLDLDGTYETGFCPGKVEDIKCCTWPVCGVSNSTVNIKGQCVPEGACGGGTFAKGLCKGPDNVMCCSGGRFGSNATATSGTLSRNSSTSTTSRTSSTTTARTNSTTAGTSTTGATTPSNATQPGPTPTAGASAISFDGSMTLCALFGVVMFGMVL